MKYCQFCGAECEDNDVYCRNCGARIVKEHRPITYLDRDDIFAKRPIHEEGIAKHRNIVACILLSAFTCGIYYLYWIYKLNEELNELTGQDQYTKSVFVIILTIFTCGIYGWYWSFKMGRRCEEIKGTSSNLGPIYLILSIIGFKIIALALMQDTINKTI